MNLKKPSPHFIRFASLVIVSLVGLSGLPVIKLIFDKALTKSSCGKDALQLSHDNFYLYFNISLALTALLLTLTLLSAVIYLFERTGSSFYRFTAKASPIASSLLIFASALFYVYLTYGSEFSVLVYITAMGICEAFVLLFPLALTGLKKEKVKTSLKNKTSKKKGSR